MTDDLKSRRQIITAGAAGAFGGFACSTVAHGMIQGEEPRRPTHRASDVAFEQSGRGAVPRTVRDKLLEVLSVKDFGAAGDGESDDTASIQAAVDAAFAAGRELFIPPGQYVLTDTIAATLPRRNYFNGGLLASIRGAGAAAVNFLFRGGSKPALHLTGNALSMDLFTIGGFSIRWPDNGPEDVPGETAAALKLEKFSIFELRDICTYRAGIGIHLLGCLNGNISMYNSSYDRRGIKMERGRYESTPNMIAIRHSVINHAIENAIENIWGSQLVLDQVAVEHTGADRMSAGYSGVPVALILDMCGAAGAKIIGTQGAYFEGNYGYDVYIRQSPFPSYYDFSGCNFNRFGTSPAQRSRACIYFDAAERAAGDAPATLNVNGATFTGYDARYVPSAETPYIAFSMGAYDGLTFLDHEAQYSHGAEVPAVPRAIAHPTIVSVSAFSNDGTLERSRGISTIKKFGIGVYRIFPMGGTEGLNLTFSHRHGAGFIPKVTGETASYIELSWTDEAGLAAAAAFCVSGIYG